MADTLFIYGTLHPDRAPAEIARAVRQLKPLGKGNVRGRLIDLGDYPGLILDNIQGKTRVTGEVFSLPDDPRVLAELDSYEEFEPGHPTRSLFYRTKVNVTLDNGKRRRSWIYVYNPGRSSHGSDALAR